MGKHEHFSECEVLGGAHTVRSQCILYSLLCLHLLLYLDHCQEALSAYCMSPYLLIHMGYDANIRKVREMNEDVHWHYPTEALLI